MNTKIEQIRADLGQQLTTVSAADGLAVIESAFKKIMKDLFTDMKALSPEDKREAGQLINALKNEFEAKFKAMKEQLASGNKTEVTIDLSIASPEFVRGKIHPLIRVGKMMEDVTRKWASLLPTDPKSSRTNITTKCSICPTITPHVICRTPSILNIRAFFSVRTPLAFR